VEVQFKPRLTMWSEPIFRFFFFQDIWVFKGKSKIYKVPTYLSVLCEFIKLQVRRCGFL